MSGVRCPITGLRPKRQIQTISAKLLCRLWKYGGGTDVSGLFQGIDRIGLFESPCGLAFFSPAIAGDDAFYRTLYGRFAIHEKTAEVARERPEYITASRHVPDGGNVLDVGAGSAGFGLHLSHASYTGLDPYAGPDAVAAGVIREPLDAHADRHPEAYDVVSAFQVMEHTTDPVAFARTLAHMVKPGGHLVLGVPLWPSPMTRCPNMLINCPPHHLTWWNEGSLQALAERLNLDIVDIRRLPPHRRHAWILWMARLNWIDMDNRFYANRLGWHLSASMGFLLGRLFDRLFGLPAKAAPIDIMLVARKA